MNRPGLGIRVALLLPRTDDDRFAAIRHTFLLEMLVFGYTRDRNDFLVSILIPSVSWSRSKRPLESPGRVTLENGLKPKPFPWGDVRALL